MPRPLAATWVAPRDEVDRGNLLGAAVVACQRDDRDLGEIVEGGDRAGAALDAGRRTGLLIAPSLEGLVLESRCLEQMVRSARDEGWRLLLLEAGADSAARSGDRWLQVADRMAGIDSSRLDGPLPEAALRRRVAGGGEDGYRRSGALHVEYFAETLAAAGVRLAGVERLLEWGAGPGRMTSHLPALAPRAQITAVDTDAEAIGWVAEHLPVHAALAIPVDPPTTLPDDAFELVIGHSVFSHLPVAAQDAWLAELARVTQPGGHVAVSFNGPPALAWHEEHPLVELPASVGQTCRRDGVAIWGGDGWEEEFYDGYHTTFHRHEYIHEHWSRWFDVIAIAPHAAGLVQDIAILRAPTGDSAQVRARVASVGHWHHRIQVAPGIVTPGAQNTQSMLAELALPEDCTGMRVLDIGARDGFFCFEAERRGAAEVVALDNVAADLTGFNVAKELLGSKAEYVVDNVYNLNVEQYGTFDLVLFLGVLYHLRHPLLALDHIWDVCNRGAQVFVESHMIDEGLVDEAGAFHRLDDFHPGLRRFPLVQFFPDRTLGNDFTSKWAPNQAALRAMFGAAGFDVTREWLHAFRGGVTAVARELDPLGQRAADAATEWDLGQNRIIRGSRYSPPEP